MIVFKNVIDNILDVCHGANNQPFVDRVKRLANVKYFELCERITSLALLRDVKELDFTTATDDGLWLPSNIISIDSVWDEDNEIEFLERDRADIDYTEPGYRFYRYIGSDTPLVVSDDVTINNGASSFTSDSVDAYVAAAVGNTVLNQYIRFGNELGYYKITNNVSPYSISPAYYGPSQDTKSFRVRPEETQRMILIDAGEEILKDRTVHVHHVRHPKPLYRDNDFILLPTSTPLELMVMRELPECKAMRPVSQGEIDDSIALASRLNPKFSKTGNPRDKNNSPYDFSTTVNFFNRRGA